MGNGGKYLENLKFTEYMEGENNRGKSNKLLEKFELMNLGVITTKLNCKSLHFTGSNK